MQLAPWARCLHAELRAGVLVHRAVLLDMQSFYGATRRLPNDSPSQPRAMLRRTSCGAAAWPAAGKVAAQAEWGAAPAARLRGPPEDAATRIVSFGATPGGPSPGYCLACSSSGRHAARRPHLVKASGRWLPRPWPRPQNARRPPGPLPTDNCPPTAPLAHITWRVGGGRGALDLRLAPRPLCLHFVARRDRVAVLGGQILLNDFQQGFICPEQRLDLLEGSPMPPAKGPARLRNLGRQCDAQLRQPRACTAASRSALALTSASTVLRAASAPHRLHATPHAQLPPRPNLPQRHCDYRGPSSTAPALACARPSALALPPLSGPPRSRGLPCISSCAILLHASSHGRTRRAPWRRAGAEKGPLQGPLFDQPPSAKSRRRTHRGRTAARGRVP